MSSDLSFFPADIDDFGLMPSELRLICHLVRRAGEDGAWNSREDMARVCRLNIKTVQRCLNALVTRNIISKESRIGQTSVYRPLPFKSWSPDPKENLTQKEPQVSKRVRTQPKRSPTHLTQTEPHKGYPKEEYPQKDIPKAAIEIPVSLSTGEFKAAWAEWIKYRRQKKKPVSAMAAVRQLSKLEAMGPVRAIAAIQHSISNDWQGIFEGNGTGTVKPADHRAVKASREYPEHINIPTIPIS